MNRKSVPWFKYQPITVHIFNVTDFAASYLYSVKTRPIELLCKVWIKPFAKNIAFKLYGYLLNDPELRHLVQYFSSVSKDSQYIVVLTFKHKQH